MSCLSAQISEYEAVHPMRSWTDLKRRVGPYRRCFVYTHSSMPDEPLVVLHTALSDEIAGSMKGIVAAASRMSGRCRAVQRSGGVAFSWTQLRASKIYRWRVSSLPTSGKGKLLVR